MIRKIKQSLIYSFLTLLLIAASFIYFIGMTTTGLKLTLAYLSHRLPGQLHIQQVAGNLLTEFTLQQISYSAPQEHVNIASLHFAWRPLQLLRTRIVISDLTVNHVQALLKLEQSSSQDHFNWQQLGWLKKIIIQQAKIDDFQIKGTVNGMPIKSSANIRFEKGQLTIHNTELSLINSTIILSGTLNNRWNIIWQANIPSLGSLIPGAYGTLTSSGSIQGSKAHPRIEATMNGAQIVLGQVSIKKLLGTLILTINDQNTFSSQISMQNIIANNYKLNLIQLSSTGKLLKENLTTELKLLVNNNQNQVTGNLTLSKFTEKLDLSQPIQSHLSVRFTDLKSLIQPTPYAKHVRGLLIGQAHITGTLRQPSISGNLALQQGHFKMTKLGLKFNDINLNADANNNKVKLMGSLHSGDGEATINGNIYLSPLSLSLNLQGTHLQAAHTAEIKIEISPRLTITMNQDEIHLHGRISIPYAKIIANHLGNTVALPSDAVIVGRPQASSHLPANLTMQIHLILGDDIELSYDALKTKLTGNIRVTQNLNTLPTVNGELITVSGTYHAYGHMFKLQKGGRLIYTGNPLNNPGLDIRAVKEIRKNMISDSSMSTHKIEPTYLGGSQLLIVGVHLSGVAEQPVMTLFSSPAGLSQGDILSYILFGYPQSQVAGAKSLALLSAATSTLDMEGANLDKMKHKIDKYLGHVDIGLESLETINPTNNSVSTSTTIGVGKELAPNLYLHYSVGNGVDLMYGFDYD